MKSVVSHVSEAHDAEPRSNAPPSVSPGLGLQGKRVSARFKTVHLQRAKQECWPAHPTSG